MPSFIPGEFPASVLSLNSETIEQKISRRSLICTARQRNTDTAKGDVQTDGTRLDVDGEDGDEFIDHWDTGELLFLSSSVLQSDRNWVSVTRSIKPYGELNHPPDWYTPKVSHLLKN
ncbi:hypothetical protein AVEN_229980-1 [Araneus ventricosus]|uniref:Uncharacterized protein n=1 Tax=Araneus ventricosus TaxID=182803 RepID=A0A4Y2BWJ8_ARAVE|nr:hypothetical protein AVEN_229980-1 [Araneus ventricosus]